MFLLWEVCGKKELGGKLSLLMVKCGQYFQLNWTRVYVYVTVWIFIAWNSISTWTFDVNSIWMWITVYYCVHVYIRNITHFALIESIQTIEIWPVCNPWSLFHNQHEYFIGLSCLNCLFAFHLFFFLCSVLSIHFCRIQLMTFRVYNLIIELVTFSTIS